MTGFIRGVGKHALQFLIGWGCMAALLCAMLGYPWPASAANAALAILAAAALHILYGRQQ